MGGQLKCCKDEGETVWVESVQTYQGKENGKGSGWLNGDEFGSPRMVPANIAVLGRVWNFTTSIETRKRATSYFRGHRLVEMQNWQSA